MDWDLIFTWGGWLIGLPAVGAFGKGIMDNYSQKNVNNSHSRIEHEYFKKRLLYETKSDLYKEFNVEIKKLEGSFYTFVQDEYDESFKGFQQDARERYKMTSKDSEEEISRRLHNYDNFEIHRFKINYELSMQVISDSLRSIGNFMSTNEYLLSEDEIELTKQIIQKSKVMKKYVFDTQHIFNSPEKDLNIKYIALKNKFGEDFKKEYNEMGELVNDLIEVIRNNLSM